MTFPPTGTTSGKRSRRLPSVDTLISKPGLPIPRPDTKLRRQCLELTGHLPYLRLSEVC